MEYKTEATKTLQEQHILYHLKILFQQLEETESELIELRNEYEKVDSLLKLMDELEEKVSLYLLELETLG